MEDRKMDLKNVIKGQGLKFHDAKPKEVKENGKMVTRYIPTERPLRADDILSHMVRGDVVTIVTKDGQRYKIDTAKKEEPKEKPNKDSKDSKKNN